MREPDTIGVLIIDDHRMFAESLGRMLGDEAGIEVLGFATSAARGIELASRLKPSVVLVDYQMPDQNGVATAIEIKRVSAATAVVILTGSTDDRVLVAAIEAGCAGFMTKDRPGAEVAGAVREAAAGGAIISPAMLARLLPKLNRTNRLQRWDLTDREREVLILLGQGQTNRAICAELNLSVNTVRNYVQSILTKLNVHSKLEAVSVAMREGIIGYPPSS